MPDVRATCRTVPGLTREQLELCYRASDVTAAAIEGLELGVRECQHQFQWHRWNCSSLSTKSRNPHTSSMLKRGKFGGTRLLIVIEYMIELIILNRKYLNFIKKKIIFWLKYLFNLANESKGIYSC